MTLSVLIAYLLGMLSALFPSISALSDNRVDNGPLGAPQPITTCIDLQNMSKNLSGYYKLMNDLNCADSRDWNGGAGFAPIGNINISPQSKFTGTLDGNYHAIYNLYISRPSSDSQYVGLFGLMSGNVINLKVLNALVRTSKEVAWSSNVGILAGRNNGTLLNVATSGEVEGTIFVGGLAGENFGQINNCWSEADVKAMPPSKGSPGGYNGGLVGANVDGKIINSYATGTVTCDDTSVCLETGGLVGELYSGGIQGSYATGGVYGFDTVGGLVGNLVSGVVENSYASGSTNGMSSVGGLVGYFQKGVISNCYAVGNVANGQVRIYTGGLIGNQLVGTSLSSSYYNVETSRQHDTGKGAPLTTQQMFQRGSFSSWDFNNIWKVKDGYDYPRLLWEEQTQLDIRFMPIVSPQKVEREFSVTVLANTPNFNGRVYLSSDRGPVKPTHIDLNNGKWTGGVTIYATGLGANLEMWWHDDVSQNNGGTQSNPFDVISLAEAVDSNARLYGTITDDQSNPLNATTVQLYAYDPKYDKQAQPLYSNRTDNQGSFQLNQVQPGGWFFVARRDGFQDYIEEMELDSLRSMTKFIILDCRCEDLIVEGAAKKVPVLLIPGIMGSTTSGAWIYPSLPFMPSTADTWKKKKLELLDPRDKLLVGPHVVGWTRLKRTLIEDYGYKEGCTLFDVPYDWALPNERSRDLFLRPWINEAKKKAKSSQVDVIAHSMGGLVTRSYTQLNDYPKDVRKFAMVATPNKGADAVYYLWEGGDPIKADMVSNDEDLYFKTKTVYYLIKERGLDDTACKFEGITRTSPKSCKYNKIYDFADREARSAGQLMPVYQNALLKTQDRTTDVPIRHKENTFLMALNGLPCTNPDGSSTPCKDQYGNEYRFAPPASVFTSDNSGTQTRLYAVIGQKTAKSIFVTPQDKSYSGNLYQDGFPVSGTHTVYFSQDDGDGTALKSSVNFNDYFPNGKQLPYEEKKEEHGSLIRAFKTRLAQFVSGVSSGVLKHDRENDPVDPTSTLVVSTIGRVQPGLNVKPTDQESEFDSGSVVVDNPANGQYTIFINSPYDTGDYEAIVSYNDLVSDNQVTRRFSDVSNKGLQSFTVNLSGSNITFDRRLDAPTDLEMRYMNGNIQLNWNDPAGDSRQDVARYEIYWKPDARPYYQYLDSTTGRQYQTNNNWANAKTDVYAVKAILKNGQKTVLSEPTFYQSCLERSTVDVSSLNGQNGFVVTTPIPLSSVSSLGDVDGDGIDDVGIGTSTPDNSTIKNAYVIYGSHLPFSPKFSVNQITSSMGFVIVDNSLKNSGPRLGYVGDINHDGVDDVSGGNVNWNAGAPYAFVYYGARDRSQLNRQTASLNGQNGFMVESLVTNPNVGSWLPIGGALNNRPVDLNGDGYADLLTGGPCDRVNGAPQCFSGGGRVYVVYGSASGKPSVFDVKNINGANGVVIQGSMSQSNPYFGMVIAGLGDINGDGIDDIAISDKLASPSGSNSDNIGVVYVIFGNKNFQNNFSADNLNGSNGFMLIGEQANMYTGRSLAGGGDVNGDGINDIIIGAQGKVYVVYGSGNGYSSRIALSSLNGNNGFIISGDVGLGQSATIVRDFNGDGIDDLASFSYIIFGSTYLPPSLEVKTLDGCNGIRVVPADSSSFANTLGSGDFNGDGLGDVIIGGDNNASVVFGRQ